MKVVLDTNVYTSAAINKFGNPFKILKAVEQGKIESFVSPEIIEELEGVLSRAKLGLSDEDVQLFIEKLLSFSVVIHPKKNLEVVKDDPDDNKILECGIDGAADYIVSGDWHLLGLREFRGIKIVTPSEMIEIMKG